MTWEEAEKFVASVLDRMEHESIQEAARRLLDLDATFAEMVAGVNTRDATIAALRAEVERLKAVETILDPKRAADIAAVVKNCRELGWSDSLLAAALNRVTDANAELTQLREDRRVLGESIQLVQTVNEDGSVTTHIPSVTLNNGESFAVIRKSVAWKWLVEADASGALGRATPP